jgi:ferredoxin-type protein NapH
MENLDRERFGPVAGLRRPAFLAGRRGVFLALLAASAVLVVSGLIAGDMAEIESDATYGNFDAPSGMSFVHRLLPGVIDAAHAKYYEFSRRIHYVPLLVIAAVFVVLWLLRTVLAFGWDLKRAIVQWAVFVVTRLGVIRVSGVAPLPRCSFGPYPFLTCQGCEMATGACPIGTFQISLSRLSLPLLTLGVMIAGGLMLGRAICGWVCPLGFFLDIAGRFIGRRETMGRRLPLVKFAVLGLVVCSGLLIGILGLGTVLPFCSTACLGGILYGLIPYYGTTAVSGLGQLLFAGGTLIAFHASVLLVFYFASRTYTARFFCRVVCPMGAFLGLFNRISLVKVVHDANACTGCGECKRHCPMDLDLSQNDFQTATNCIRCGACVNLCPAGARTWSFLPKRQKLQDGEEQGIAANEKTGNKVILVNKS